MGRPRGGGRVKVDVMEGLLDDFLWFRYDMENDVLYLRLVEHRYAPAHSEETQDGILLLRREDNGEVAGITIVNWWKRCGDGPLPDSIHELEQAIAP
ncbi:MAG: DUF2283 domain-containing protein [Candidatus Hydrogenedentota bacterium]